MGRKRKFGEESDFVSVRVPKSKRKEYRDAIKNFVEDKFASELESKREDGEISPNRIKSEEFRKFEEFIKDLKDMEKEKDNK